MDEGLSVGEIDFEALIAREWLVANETGGYASSTVPCLNARRSHGLLVAALSPPEQRHVMLSRVEETVIWDQGCAELACNEYPGTIYPRGDQLLRAFSHDPHPRWGYQSGGWTIEKQLRLTRHGNTVVLTYTLLGAERPLELEVRPLLALRPVSELVYQGNGRLVVVPTGPAQFQIPATSRTPELFFASYGDFRSDSCWYLNTIYRRDSEHGRPVLEDLWSPGVCRFGLSPGKPAHFVCSADPIDLPGAIATVAQQSISQAQRLTDVASSSGKADNANPSRGQSRESVTSG